jgi:nucleoside-diphosphate-sugar epimerase
VKVLSLGAGGFIGAHLTERLLEAGHIVTAVDIHSDKIDDLIGHPRLTFVERSIADRTFDLGGMIAAADVVVDLVAHANPGIYVRQPLDVFRLNFQENLRIAETCVEKGRRLIQFSSCEVYGKTPVAVLHAYGLEGRLNYTIIRPFNFIGPKIDYLPGETDGVPRVFSYFMEALLDGTPMKLVDGGNQRRCYTFIRDAVDCVARIVDNPGGACDRQIFNIGSPENEVSIRELAALMRDLYARHFAAEGARLPEIVDVSAEKFYGEGYEDSDRRIPDIEKARRLLGWNPRTSLVDMLMPTMTYYVHARRDAAALESTVGAAPGPAAGSRANDPDA